MALLDAIEDRHDEPAGLTTSQSALDTYTAEDALEYDPDDGTVQDGPADRVKWYGNILGSNEFKEKRVGAVIGSNHYGDTFIKKWGAYDGNAIERGPGKGADLTYGDYGDHILAHMREHDTLQAAMRYGRDGNGAVVYVHTNTLPEWTTVAGEGRVIETWSDGMKSVLKAAEDLGSEFTTADVADHPTVEIGGRKILEHLKKLISRGYISGSIDGGRYTWKEDGLHRVSDHGDAELEPVSIEGLRTGEVDELARSSNYTWQFVNTPMEGGAEDQVQCSGGRRNWLTRSMGEGDPPD